MNIGREELKEKLNENILRRIKSDSYELQSFSPIELLSPNRIDVLVKYLYVKFREEGIQSDFAKKLYLEHINLLNGFVENDESMKIGKKEFLTSFNTLIDSIKCNGFDDSKILPLCNDQTILDGGHRLACALYFGESLPAVHLACGGMKLDLQFFRQRGLTVGASDLLALEYAKLKDNVRMVIIWPKANGGEAVLNKIFKSFGKIVYEKRIYLNANGLTQLTRTAYSGEDWLGSSRNDFEGARNKAKMCFGDSATRVYLFETKHDMVEMKEQIRSHFNLGKHSVHINDTKEETIDLASLLFNENSIHHLNFSRIKEFKCFNNLFKEYTTAITGESFDANSFILIGGVLAAYGIKQSKDIDFLSPSAKLIKFENESIEEETSKIKYSQVPTPELIFNPKFYFYYKGVKMVSVNVIRQIKYARGNDNDKLDLKF